MHSACVQHPSLALPVAALRIPGLLEGELPLRSRSLGRFSGASMGEFVSDKCLTAIFISRAGSLGQFASLVERVSFGGAHGVYSVIVCRYSLDE